MPVARVAGTTASVAEAVPLTPSLRDSSDVRTDRRVAVPATVRASPQSALSTLTASAAK
jgi:hypothetical protein